MLSVILFLLLETTDLPHVVHFSPRRGCTTVLICNDWGADRGEGKGSKKRFWTHLHGGCNNSWPMVLGYYAIKTKEIWKRNKLLYFYIYIYIVEKSSFDKEGSFRTAQTIFSRCVTAKEKKKKKREKAIYTRTTFDGIEHRPRNTFICPRSSSAVLCLPCTMLSRKMNRPVRRVEAAAPQPTPRPRRFSTSPLAREDRRESASFHASDTRHPWNRVDFESVRYRLV